MSPRIALSALVLALTPFVAAADADFSLPAGLPDPLRTFAGRTIDTPADWAALRRPELLEAFRAHVYGRDAVGRPDGQSFAIEEADAPALDGLALRRRVRIDLPGPGGAVSIRATLYRPAGDARPKSCVVLIVNRSRRIIDEAETAPREFWPVRDIVARGHATIAFHYGDVAADRPERAFDGGVFRAFGPGENPRPDDAWGTVAAWAWGASRVVDYVVAAPDLAGAPVAVAGHSRGGKAALWCGAQDERVALAISNNSGCTGAALARGTSGETVEVINRKFPHWFAPAYHAYAGREAELPVDQHLLLALHAPRRVYVASAADDANADPRSEFLACVGAAPVFALHGLGGAGAAEFPAVGEARHEGAIGYHLRAGGHDLLREDWSRFLDYAERHLR